MAGLTTAQEARERLGFRDGDGGAHSSRTMMLAELVALLEAAPADAGRADYRALVVDENVPGKRSAGNREKTFKRLCELYALKPDVAVFRLLRRLWGDDAEGRPLLALLCACARDPLLRGSAGAVLDAAPGTPIGPQALGATVRRPLAATTRKSLGQNLASTWTQAGFLAGKVRKTRSRAHATPGAAAYALALGYMEGGRGSLLLDTFWTRLLDRAPDEVLGLVQAAARRGFIEYRAAGDIMDIRVEGLFTETEREWCRAQQG